MPMPRNKPETIWQRVSNYGEKADKHDDSVEQQDFFVQQNPATRKMGSLVSETYDAMIASMASEIAKVLK